MVKPLFLCFVDRSGGAIAEVNIVSLITAIQFAYI